MEANNSDKESYAKSIYAGSKFDELTITHLLLIYNPIYL